MPDSICYSPIKIAELDNLLIGGRDFIYLEKEGVLMVAMSDMNVTSRIDSYLTNFSLPWEKTPGSDIVSTVGALALYQVSFGKNEEWKFERMWIKTFSSQTNILNWNAEMETLLIGLDSGKVIGLKIPSKHHYMRYEEVIFCNNL